MTSRIPSTVVLTLAIPLLIAPTGTTNDHIGDFNWALEIEGVTQAQGLLGVNDVELDALHELHGADDQRHAWQELVQGDPVTPLYSVGDAGVTIDFIEELTPETYELDRPVALVMPLFFDDGTKGLLVLDDTYTGALLSME